MAFESGKLYLCKKLKNFIEMLTWIWFQIWSRFSSIWGAILVPKSVPKLTPKTRFWGFMFGTFFEVLKLFRCLVGASLSLLCSSWGRLGSWEPPRLEKYWYCTGKHHFLKCCFSVLWGSRCLSCVHLGASYPVLSPKWLPKWTQNGTQNHTKKSKNRYSFEPHSWQFAGHFWNLFRASTRKGANCLGLPGDPRGQQNGLKTWNCRQHQLLALKSFLILLKILIRNGLKREAVANPASMISKRQKHWQDVTIACTRTSNKRSYTSKIKRVPIQQPQNEQRC